MTGIEQLEAKRSGAGAHSGEPFEVRLQRAIGHIRQGDKTRAYELVSALSHDDPLQPQAWLWRASLANNQVEACWCLERVLVLDPGNERARSWLLRLNPARSSASGTGSESVASGETSGTGVEVQAQAVSLQPDPAEASKAEPMPVEPAAEPESASLAGPETEPAIVSSEVVGSEPEADASPVATGQATAPVPSLVDGSTVSPANGPVETSGAVRVEADPVVDVEPAPGATAEPAAAEAALAEPSEGLDAELAAVDPLAGPEPATPAIERATAEPLAAEAELAVQRPNEPSEGIDAELAAADPIEEPEPATPAIEGATAEPLAAEAEQAVQLASGPGEGSEAELAAVDTVAEPEPAIAAIEATAESLTAEAELVIQSSEPAEALGTDLATVDPGVKPEPSAQVSEQTEAESLAAEAEMAVQTASGPSEGSEAELAAVDTVAEPEPATPAMEQAIEESLDAEAAPAFETASEAVEATEAKSPDPEVEPAFQRAGEFSEESEAELTVADPAAEPEPSAQASEQATLEPLDADAAFAVQPASEPRNGSEAEQVTADRSPEALEAEHATAESRIAEGAIFVEPPATDTAWHSKPPDAEAEPAPQGASYSPLTETPFRVDADSESLNPSPNASLDVIARWPEAQQPEPGPAGVAAASRLTCPFCLTHAAELFDCCPSCGALHVLDTGRLATHGGVLAEPSRESRLRAYLARLANDPSLDDFERSYWQGIGHLNLAESELAIPHLQNAAHLRPLHTALFRAVYELIGRKVVLVADDSATIRVSVSRSLERSQIRAITTADGMEALKRIAERPVDLVLLDINMPFISGWDVCKALRNHPHTKKLPIVMLSGKDGLFDKMKGRMVGANAYVTKPVDPFTLVRTVKRHLGVA
ncbi:MAG: response regulator [Acidobacteria bacterium]|nr:response regulator [Acidobacteriota bacterium]